MKIFITALITVFAATASAQVEVHKLPQQSSSAAKDYSKMPRVFERQTSGPALTSAGSSPAKSTDPKVVLPTGKTMSKRSSSAPVVWDSQKASKAIEQAKKDGQHMTIITSEGRFSTEPEIKQDGTEIKK